MYEYLNLQISSISILDNPGNITFIINVADRKLHDITASNKSNFNFKNFKKSNHGIHNRFTNINGRNFSHCIISFHLSTGI